VLKHLHLHWTPLFFALVASPAYGHEQSAVSSGKRVQPTKNSVEQRLKEHEARPKPRSSNNDAKPNERSGTSK
jgi:hypothetical protein